MEALDLQPLWYDEWCKYFPINQLRSTCCNAGVYFGWDGGGSTRIATVCHKCKYRLTLDQLWVYV